MDKLFENLDKLTVMYREHGLDESVIAAVAELDALIRPYGYTITNDEYLAAFVIVPRGKEEPKID